MEEQTNGQIVKKIKALSSIYKDDTVFGMEVRKVVHKLKLADIQKEKRELEIQKMRMTSQYKEIYETSLTKNAKNITSSKVLKQQEQHGN